MSSEIDIQRMREEFEYLLRRAEIGDCEFAKTTALFLVDVLVDVFDVYSKTPEKEHR